MKQAFSFNISNKSKKINLSLPRNEIFNEEFEKDSKTNIDLINSNINFEYKQSEAFYKEHPELLLDFDEKHINNVDRRGSINDDTSNEKNLESRYMSKIKEYVSLRNIEKQEIQEEKIHKEIELENNEQVFITDAYLDLLKERKKIKEKLNTERLSNKNDNFDKNIFQMRFSEETNNNKRQLENDQKLENGKYDQSKDNQKVNVQLENNQRLKVDQHKEMSQEKNKLTKDAFEIKNNKEFKLKQMKTIFNNSYLDSTYINLNDNLINVNENLSSEKKKLLKIESARERYLLRKKLKNKMNV